MLLHKTAYVSLRFIRRTGSRRKRIQVDLESRRSVEQFEGDHTFKQFETKMSSMMTTHAFEEFEVKNEFKDDHAFEEFED